MNKLNQAITVILLANMAAAASAAGIDIGGNNEQIAELKNSPQTSLAIGAGAKASSSVNLIEGKVKIAGNNKQTAKLTNSPQTALAIGALATATNNVNVLRGN